MKNFSVVLMRKAHLESLQTEFNKVQTQNAKAAQFVKEIASGNLDVQYQEDLNSNVLATSLITMRDQMKKFSQEEKQRNWVTEGLASFVDILRSKNDIQALSDEIISSLVRYLKANQGALYVLNDDNPQDIFMDMVGCYAYNKKKHLRKRINLGEGITGQVVLEKSTAYLTSIPADYIKITSGLGEALPRNLLVVPLKLEENVYGVMEIASFDIFKKYQIDFVEKLAESIAAAIYSVKHSERTKNLLEETQAQAEQMRSQEEEMRQNMEELSATQEEMQRAQKRTEEALQKVSEKEAYLNNMLNATEDAILTVDKDLHVVLANQVMIKTFRAQGIMVDVGFPVTRLSQPGKEADFEIPYRRAFQGESVEVERSYFEHEYLISYNPIRATSGEIIGVSLFTKDVTTQKKLQQQTEEMLRAEQERMTAAKRNREVLTMLTKSLHVQNGEWQEALEEITRTLAEVLGITRAAVWSYHSESRSIFLEKIYQADEHKFLSGAELFRKDIPTYFQAIESEDIIVAEDSFQHPSLVEFHKGYLDVLDVRSMLDVPYFLDGNVGGVICCENQNVQKKWTEADVEFAKSVADIITIAFKSYQASSLLMESQKQSEQLRAQEEEIRQNLEELSATQEEMHRQLKEIERVKQALEVRENVFGFTTILSEADAHGNITMVNDKLCQVSGYTREELLNQPHNIFRHPDMPSALFKIFWKTIKSGKVFKGIIKNRAKDGSVYWVDATIVPVKDDEGNIYKYIGARYLLEDEHFAVTLYNKQAEKLQLPTLTESIHAIS